MFVMCYVQALYLTYSLREKKLACEKLVSLDTVLELVMHFIIFHLFGE